MSNSTAGLARSRIYISLYYDRGSIEFSLVSLATRYHRHVTMNVITPTRECHPASERNRVPLRFRAEHDPPWTHAINIYVCVCVCVRATRFSETSFRFRKRWSLKRVKWFWKRGGVIWFLQSTYVVWIVLFRSNSVFLSFDRFPKFEARQEESFSMCIRCVISYLKHILIATTGFLKTSTS